MVKNKILALGLIGGWLISAVFIGGCVPAGETGEEGIPWSMLILVGLIAATMYFLIIRPQRRKQKKQEELTAELSKGDRVITAGGIYGQIESISEDSVILKVESGTTMRIVKGSIVTKQSR